MATTTKRADELVAGELVTEREDGYLLRVDAVNKTAAGEIEIVASSMMSQTKATVRPDSLVWVYASDD